MHLGYSGVLGNVTIAGETGTCDQLPQHKITSVIHLNGATSILANYTFHGYSADHCDDDRVVTKPLKLNVPIFLNERNSICSFSLGKRPLLQVTVTFTHTVVSNVSAFFTTDNTNCNNICNSDESYHYPSQLGINEEDGNPANNFVRLYSKPGCFYDNIILNRNGSEEIKAGVDLFELTDPIFVVKSFIVSTS